MFTLSVKNEISHINQHQPLKNPYLLTTIWHSFLL